MKILILAALIGLSACATRPPAPADAFMSQLRALCGQSFAGRLVTTDPADADMAGKPLTMHVRECSADQVRIPFHVGEDHSRTWVLTRTAPGVRLKHDHRHGLVEDKVSQYGGDSVSAGTSWRQEFPADAFSRELFIREGLPVSIGNVWAMEIQPGRVFAYELRRTNRHFRVEFDLTRPL